MPKDNREQVSLYLSDDELTAWNCCPETLTPHGWVVRLVGDFVARKRPLSAVAARSTAGVHRRTISLPADLAQSLTQLASGASHAEVLRTLLLESAGIAYEPQLTQGESAADLVVPVAVPATLRDDQVLPAIEADLAQRRRPSVRVVPVRIPAALRERLDVARMNQAPSVYLSTLLARASERRRAATAPPVELVIADPRLWQRRLNEYRIAGWPPHLVQLRANARVGPAEVADHLGALRVGSVDRLLLLWDNDQSPEDDGLDHLCQVVSSEAAILGLRCTVEVGVLEEHSGIRVLVEIVRR